MKSKYLWNEKYWRFGIIICKMIETCILYEISSWAIDDVCKWGCKVSDPTLTTSFVFKETVNGWTLGHWTKLLKWSHKSEHDT